MSPEISLILAISFIIFFSPFVAKMIKIPTTPVEIILGSLAGYFHIISHDLPLFEYIAEFGFLYLMFIAGMEVNVRKLLKLEKAIHYKTLIYILLLYGLSYGACVIFNLSNIFLVIFPLISVGLIATLSKEYGKTEWVKLSMTVGILAEVVSIAMLTITAAALEFGFTMELYQAIFLLGLFLVGMLVVFKTLRVLFWWYPELSTTLMPHSDNKEQDIRLSMAILFIFLALMLALGLELAFGAFIAGMIIPTFFEHKEQLPEKLSSYGFGFLIPIFFIHVGSSFDINAIMIDGLLLKAMQITVIMIGIRIISALVFSKKIGFKNTVLFGLSQSMPLTLLIAVATLAYNMLSIDQFHFYAFILASIFEVIVAMVAIKLISFPPKIAFLEKRKKKS